MKLPYLLNLILFLLVVGLYVLHFSGKKASKKPLEQEDTAQTETKKAHTSKIAYVNMDTLFEYYDYYQVLSEDFGKKKEKAQKNLEKRGRKLESDMLSFRRRAEAGLMSQNDIRAAEQKLLAQQEELQRYSQTVSAGLLEEESVLNQKLYDNIQAYLKTYNKEKQYDLIINYAERSPAFWLAQEGLDITQIVLDSINQRHKMGQLEQQQSE